MKDTVNTTPHSNNKNSNTTGAWAEQFALDWLVQQGLSAHSTNFHRRLGEIDLIVRDEACNTWVFVEVKYRQLNAKVSGVESITTQKQRKLLRTAHLFLQRTNDHRSNARIDVVVITPHNDNSYNDSTLPRSEEPLRSTPKPCMDGHLHAVLNGYRILWIKNAIY